VAPTTAAPWTGPRPGDCTAPARPPWVAPGPPPAAVALLAEVARGRSLVRLVGRVPCGLGLGETVHLHNNNNNPLQGRYLAADSVRDSDCGRTADDGQIETESRLSQDAQSMLWGYEHGLLKHADEGRNQ